MARAKAPALRVPGYRATGIHCGIKAKAPDLALVVSDEPARVAGVFTKSTVVGAPVEWCRERVRGGKGRALVVNSGISNVAMGNAGRKANLEVARAAAAAVGCKVEEVLVGATGVIGEPLPLDLLRAGIAQAEGRLSGKADGFARAAEAIRTTDTVAKLALRRVTLGGKRVTIGGITKGSGMIEPNMATMLGYVFTDAAIGGAYLRRLLREAVEPTFNRVTVDGETSTSDMVLLFANGVAGNRRLDAQGIRGARAFATGLGEVCEDLAKQIARDGEGATKLVTVHVLGARSGAEAERAARRIANSLLVKTALFGNDPNWGRILQTVGAGETTIALERSEIRLAGVPVFTRGRSAGPQARRRAYKAMQGDEVAIEVRLGAGKGRATIWTCDLSYDYVRINAEYTT